MAQPARHRERAGKLYLPAIQSSASLQDLQSQRLGAYQQAGLVDEVAGPNPMQRFSASIR
jgi:hypothetical protein